MEGDRDIQLLTANTVIFQSTPSAWRETAAYARKMPEWYISIHSLRMEGDFTIPMFFFVPETFQSTPSAWRETIVDVVP